MKVFIFISLLFIQLVSFCQSSYESGYITNNQGDTIVGLIDIQTNNQNSRSCIYRANEESKPKEFLPTEIKAYGLDNGLAYISKQIDFNGELDYYFLEYLVNGTVDLYYLEHLNLGYYYIEKDSDFVQLSKTDKEVLIDGRRYLKESNEYIGALSYLYGDSPEMKSSIQNTAFTHKSLIKVTQEYHNNMCPDEECIVYQKSTKTRIVFEPTLGLKYSELTFDYDYAPNLNPVIGLLVKFFPAKYNNYLSVNTGLMYSSSDFVYTYREDTDELYIGIDANVKFNTLKLPLNIEYTFNGGKFQPQLELGITQIFVLDPSYESTRAFYVGGEISSIINENFGDNVTFESYQVISIGLGGKFNFINKSYISCKIFYEYGLTRIATQHHSLGSADEGVIKNSITATIGYGFALTK